MSAGLFTAENRADETRQSLSTFRKGRLLTEKVANLKGPPALLSPRDTRKNKREKGLEGGTRVGKGVRLTSNKQLCCYEMFTTRLLSAASCAPGGAATNLSCIINVIGGKRAQGLHADDGVSFCERK